MSLDNPGPNPVRGPFAQTAQIVAATGLIALGAANYFSKLVGPDPVHGGAAAQAIPGDPEVTGSIGEAARRTALDPCALRQKPIAR